MEAARYSLPADDGLTDLKQDLGMVTPDRSGEGELKLGYTAQLNPDESSGYSLPADDGFEDLKTDLGIREEIRPGWTARELEHGRISAPEKKKPLSAVTDWVWENLVPVLPMLTEEGGMMAEAGLTPSGEPAKSGANAAFGQYVLLLEWMVGGPHGVAALGRKILNKAAKETMKGGGKQVMNNLLKESRIPPSNNVKRTWEAFWDSMSQIERNPVKRAWSDFHQFRSKAPEKVVDDALKNIKPLPLIKKESGVIIKSGRSPQFPQASPKAEKPFLEGGKKAEPIPKRDIDKLNEFRAQKGIPPILEMHAGLPLDMALRDVVKLGKKAIGHWYWKPKLPKDINMWTEMAQLPHWVSKKFPKIKRFYHIERAREEARSEISHAFLEGAEDFLKLKGDDYKFVKKLLVEGDMQGKAWDAPDLLRAGVSEDAIKAYQGVRKTLNSIRDDYIKRMEQSDVPKNEIAEYIREIGRVKGYFPRVREGRFFVVAEKEGAEPIRMHFNAWKGGKVVRELKAEGYKIIDQGQNPKLPEEIYFKVSPEAINAVTDLATKNWDDATRQMLKQNIGDVIKERGFLSHGIRRQEDLVGGYETENLKNVLFNYINGYSGFVTKLEAGKAFRKELIDLSFGPKGQGPANLENIYRYAEKYTKDMLENADNFDSISGKIRSAFFYKYLGGVVKSGFVNLSQNFIAAAPRLSLETKWAYPKLSKAMGDIVSHYASKGKKGLLPDEIRALRIALQKGWTRDLYTQELIGHMSKVGSVSSAVKKIAGFPMATAEKYNRQSTFLAAYRVFKEKAVKKNFATADDAMEWVINKASGVVEDSHFVYGNRNLPGIFRGTKAGKIARSGYTFRTFTHNYVNLLVHMYRKDKAAVAKSLAAVGAIGGVSSLPFFKTAESIAMRYGYNPRSYIKKKLEEHDMGDIAELGFYGLPHLLGVDLGGSIGIELPGQRAISTEDVGSAIGGIAVDILGVPASLAEDTISAAEQLYYGDYSRAIEDSPFTPTAVSNFMSAHRYATKGMRTRKGAPIRPEDDPFDIRKFTAGQVVSRGILGFQPSESTEDYRKYKGRQAEKRRWDTKKGAIKAQFMKNFGTPAVDKVWDKIEHFNMTRPDYVTDIDPSKWEDVMFGREPTEREELLKEAIR